MKVFKYKTFYIWDPSQFSLQIFPVFRKHSSLSLISILSTNTSSLTHHFQLFYIHLNSLYKYSSQLFTNISSVPGTLVTFSYLTLISILSFPHTLIPFKYLTLILILLKDFLVSLALSSLPVIWNSSQIQIFPLFLLRSSLSVI